MKLDGLVAQYAQYDRLLMTAAENLDITERLLAQYNLCGNISVIVAHVTSVKV